VPLLGRFDETFLQVPREVIQLTMRTNQKYFAATNGEGKLAPAFICVANIAASDGGARIIAGNQKVLAARLADARFFWEQDLKTPLQDQAAKLGQIVFHEKLGTLADKVERVAKLARWLVEEGIVGGASRSAVTNHRHPRESGDPASSLSGQEGSWTPASAGVTADQSGAGPNPARGPDLADLATRAARLCKADLVTQMVGEFPELQGLIGGYLAAAQGEDPQVAAAIRDHYKPVGQGDEVPTDPATVAVSLADKLDSLFQFFLVQERPSGSKDPFALRRSGLGIISLILSNGVRVRLADLLNLCSEVEELSYPECEPAADWMQKYGSSYDELSSFNLTQEEAANPDFSRGLLFGHALRGARKALMSFFADRLKVQQREAGVRHDLIDAVFALGGEDDLVRLLARVRALQAFVETPEGTDLLAGYKRAANILKKENMQAEQDANKTLSYTPEIVEAALISALDSAEAQALAAIAREDFEGAMAALATLRGPVDAFFDKVTVNDPDADKRAARLSLLARIRTIMHQVADFSGSRVEPGGRSDRPLV
jgi:glycyl-tRNA synthetase beta chain